MAERSKVISADGPTPTEAEFDATVVAWCTTRREPEEESERRRNVLQRLQAIMKAWIRSLMITKLRMSPELANQVEGRLFTTGSYRYNVHSSGSDIDMVLIAPNHVTRDDFFDTLAPRLQTEPWISQMDMIRDAKVPLIAMKCDGIDIDLSFGAVHLNHVPEVITDDLLRGLDESSVRSCNAVRVAHAIIELVPNKGVFRQALRFVKAWGKARGVYNLKLGFPSGIGWAILVAFVSQCYPNKNAAGMIARFFRVLSTWFRSDVRKTGVANRAIYLTESLTPKTNIGRCWDPRTSARDAEALFPVLTPANPYSNACYNVSLSTLRVMCDEFQRGSSILTEAFASNPKQYEQFGEFGVWKHVLESYPIFTSHKLFLRVQVSCSDPLLYSRYVDAVETRIGLLWAENPHTRGKALEAYDNVRVRVYSTRFEAEEEVAAREEAVKADKAGTTPSRPMPALFTAHFFAGLDVMPDPPAAAAATTAAPGAAAAPKRKIDLTAIVQMFHAQVKTLNGFQAPQTKMPVVDVVSVDKIPAWITGQQVTRKRERETEVEATGVVPAAAPREQTGETRAAKAGESVDGPKPEVAAATNLSSEAMKLQQQQLAAQEQSKAKAALDEALGMDF